MYTLEFPCIPLITLKYPCIPLCTPEYPLNTTVYPCIPLNQKGHKLTDIELIPLELINSKRESIRRARVSFYIDKAKTLQPHGINREDDY